MKVYVISVFVVLMIIIIFLIIKIAVLKNNIRSTAEQLDEKLKVNTNTLIKVSSYDKDIRFLASALNDELMRLNAERHRYLSGDRELKNALINVTHDIRTPLTAALGYLSLAENENDVIKQKDYIEITKERCIKLKELTDELLDYSLASALPEINKTKINLSKALEESVLSFYAALKNAGIEPHINLPSEPVYKNLDINALNRIFGNIINNAVKYSDNDLCIDLEKDGTVSFSNSALSLSKVDTGRLFDRFYTVNSGGRSTGLGLSIAKNLTCQMGGSIDALYESGRLYIKIKFPEN